MAIMVAVAALAGCDSNNPAPQAKASSTVATTSSTPNDPECLPTVTETGFSVVGHDILYGLVARSDCPEAFYGLVTSVRVLDSTGQPIDGKNELSPEIEVMLPGERVGAAGSFYMTNPATPERVEVRFTDGEPAPVSAFASWPTARRVVDLTTTSARGSPESVTVSGRIVAEPADAVLCWPRASLILRDHTGKIIYGQTDYHNNTLVTFDLTMPPGTDPSKTEIYVALGKPAISLNPLAAAACRA